MVAKREWVFHDDLFDSVDDWTGEEWDEIFDSGRHTSEGERVAYNRFAWNRWDTKPRASRSHS